MPPVAIMTIQKPVGLALIFEIGTQRASQDISAYSLPVSEVILSSHHLADKFEFEFKHQ